MPQKATKKKAKKKYAVAKVTSRREKVKMLLTRGITHTEMAKVLKVDRATIQRDIAVIGEEFLQEIKKKGFESVLAEFLMRHDKRHRDLYKYIDESYKQKDMKAVARFEKLLQDNDSQKLLWLQSLGIIKKVPEQLITEIEVKWKWPKTMKRGKDENND